MSGYNEARRLPSLTLFGVLSVFLVVACGAEAAQTPISSPKAAVETIPTTELEPTATTVPSPVLQATSTPPPPPTVPVAISALVPTAGPTPTPMPTPNIDATVEARLQTAMAAAATTPEPTPDIESTVEARVLATIAAMAESKPNPTPTVPAATQVPDATPTPIPVPIQEAAPSTPIPPTVYGVLEVGFEPRGSGTVAPEPPIDAAFVIESVNGKTSIIWITDSDPGTGSFVNRRTILDFGLVLDPGEYIITNLIGQHPELYDEPVSFPSFRVALSNLYKFATLEFIVPETGCIHIGRISATYFRVSPGSRAEQDRVIEQIIREIRGTANYVYLSAGSIVAKSARHETLDREEWINEAKTRDCRAARPKWVAG